MATTEWGDEQLNYLRQPEFVRLWAAVRQKYERLGRVGGTVRLAGPDPAERQALEGLLAVNLRGAAQVAVSLVQLDQALRETKFALSLPEALQLLFPELKTRKEQELRAHREWERFCEWAAGEFRTGRWRGWADKLRSGEGAGYRAFLECFEMFNREGMCRDWTTAARALESLPAGEAVRLPLFAARVVGDPHGLDRDRLSGRLFYYGLLDAEARAEDAAAGGDGSSVEGGSSAEYIRDVYAAQGLLLDDISSCVWVGNWQGLAEEPVALPLWTIERMIAADRIPAAAHVRVVENPSVFGELLGKSMGGHGRDGQGQGFHAPLICTSGQPAIAALKLMDRVAGTGGRIHYAGDFDVKGLEMALNLQQRYGASWLPWRMDTATYSTYVHEHAPLFAEYERDALSRMGLPWDRGLIPAMLACGRKLFQEQVGSLFA